MSEESGEEERSFEERLKAARSRQGLDTPPPVPGNQSGDIGGMAVHIAHIAIAYLAARVRDTGVLN